MVSLASGRSGAVSGEVRSAGVILFSNINPVYKISYMGGPMLNDKTFEGRWGASAVQYRLSPTGATFFVRGTARGVL